MENTLKSKNVNWVIATGVAIVIILGGAYLLLPWTANETPYDALFNSSRELKNTNVSPGLMRGEDVKALQQALVDLGYPLPQFGTDGIFGTETEGAVKVFQTDAGIGIDGIVGPETRRALRERLIK